MTLGGNERMLEIERGSTRSHYVENSLRKRLWTWRKTKLRGGGDVTAWWW
jgi:hypothetical protein